MSQLTKVQLELLDENFSNLEFLRNFPLSQLNYFEVGGLGKAVVLVQTTDDLIDLIWFCRSNSIEYVLLGGGSNVVVSDKGISKLVIVTRNYKIEIVSSDGDLVVIRAECGVSTAKLVRFSVKHGLTGLEPFMGVPGKLGGAIFNNSHFQKELIGDYVKRVEVLNKNGDVVWINKIECDFAYDSSRFQKTKEVILRVEFALKRGEDKKIQTILKDSMNYRSRTQPLGVSSSGCIFKNVPNDSRLQQMFPQFSDKPFISAGFLIDQAGLKGIREGGIEISTKHAAFFVNTGQGKASEILKLIEHVKQEVKDQFGVQLQEEVFWLE